jgi:hypothetical protein
MSTTHPAALVPLKVVAVYGEEIVAGTPWHGRAVHSATSCGRGDSRSSRLARTR